MSTKRKTKKEREEERRSGLREKVRLIAMGAYGESVDDDSFFMAEHLSRLIPALQAEFPDAAEWLWRPFNLDNFNDAESITDLLFRAGVAP